AARAGGVGRVMSRHQHGAMHSLDERRGGESRRARARSLKERAHRRVDALDCVAHVFEDGDLRVSRLASLDENVYDAPDARQRVLDLVREARGQLADEREVRGARQFRFEPALLRDVYGRGYEAGDAASLV